MISPQILRTTDWRQLFFTIASLLTSIFLVTANAQNLNIKDPIVRLLPPVSKTTAAYMKVDNTTDKKVEINGVSCTVAEVCELHEHTMEGGVMKMRQKSVVTIPPKGSWVLKPKGDHVMIINLKAPLKEGDRVDLVFSTIDGAKINTQAIVTKMQGADSEEAMGASPHHH